MTTRTADRTRLAESPPGHLLDWLGETSFGAEPPIYSLLPPREALQHTANGVETRLQESFDIPFEHWHPASGAFRFWLPRDVRELAPSGISERLAYVCEAVDERAYEPRLDDPDLSEMLVAVVQSRIADYGLPVLGPGGMLTLFDDTRRIVGDLVVRRRGEEISEPGRWREPEEIAEPITARFDRAGVKLSAELGYFEASRFTEQRLLRPAYVVVIDRPQPAGEGPGWRTVVVEPATHVEGLEPWEGLEEWWEG